MSKERAKDEGADVFLLEGKDVLADDELLIKIVKCFVDVYSRPPWNEEFEVQAVAETYRRDLSAEEGVVPLLSYRLEGEEVASFNSGLVLSADKRGRVDKILLSAPYFGGIAIGPDKVLAEFWGEVGLIDDEKFLFIYDTASRTENSRYWVLSSDRISQKALELGADKLVGFTLENSGIYRPLKRTGVVTYEHEVSLCDSAEGEARGFLIYSDKFDAFAGYLNKIAGRILE